MAARPVRLVVSDVEGCVIPGSGRPWDLAVLADLAAYTRRAGRDAGLPPFTLASGRPVQYVEALGHALGLEWPVCCENGAVLFHPREGRAELLASEEQQALMEEVRRFLRTLPARRGRWRVAVGKEVCVSLVPVDPGLDAARLLAEAREAVAAGLGLGDGQLHFTRSAGAVDIVPAGLDKGTGVRALAERLGISPQDVLAIGDSLNDLPLLAAAGVACAPGNADPEVRGRVAYVSPAPYGAGVLDVLRRFVAPGGW